MVSFSRYIGIDYSGAATARSSLKGLRVFAANGGAAPVEVLPPASLRKYWTRRGIAEWLVEGLSEDVPTLVGIDHGFSFPLRYFEVHRLQPDWQTFLDDFQRHWPTDRDNTYVDFVRDGLVGDGAARMGEARWRRLTEERAGGAKSVFHFDVQGSVAKSTHAGIPWLRFLRAQLGGRVHFWPFDGWTIPPGRSAVAEVYPSLWRNDFVRGDRDDHQFDAFCVAAALSRADRDGTLRSLLAPELTAPERTVAQVEGWILGVSGARAPKRRTGAGAANAASRAGQQAERIRAATQTTRYFEEQVLRKRPYIRREWCIQVLAAPIASNAQANGRLRFWGPVADPRDGKTRFLRVVTLADGTTVHNAFFDRNFKVATP